MRVIDVLRKTAKRKLHTGAGFTLAEMLLTILILLMVSAIMVRGIPVAREAYEKVVLASNAEVLLSTTISTLRNELGTAQEIKTPDTATVSYYSPTRGAISRIFVAEEGQAIQFQRYYDRDGLSAAYDPVPLVSPETATQGLYVTFASVSYADGIVTFTGLSVDRTGGSRGLASRDALSVRVIAEG